MKKDMPEEESLLLYEEIGPLDPENVTNTLCIVIISFCYQTVIKHYI
jgi:hypothetical protein